MAVLHVVFDPTNHLSVQREFMPPEIRTASLSIPADLSAQDIYAIARKLAELLLEQVSR